MNIEIKVDTAKFDRILSNFPAAMKRAQRNALMAIGEEAVSEADRAFKHPHYRPSPWMPRKSGGNWPLLVKHPNGGLRASIISKLKGNDTVVVGTDKKYAGYHQFDTKHMPSVRSCRLTGAGTFCRVCSGKSSGLSMTPWPTSCADSAFSDRARP